MADLNEAVRAYASDLAEKIHSFIKDVSILEVRTYTSPLDANGEINQTLWQLHQQAVQQATQHRERMMVALGEAAASAIKALRAANG